MNTITTTTHYQILFVIRTSTGESLIKVRMPDGSVTYVRSTKPFN